MLLGVLVEAVTGQPIPSYIDQHLLQPLHLDHTALPTGDVFPDPHAHGYAEVGESQPVDVTDLNRSWAGAAGAMYSNLEDMRIWARALGTGALLTPTTHAERLETVPYPNEPEGTVHGLGIEGFAGWLGHIGDLIGYNSLELYLPRNARPWSSSPTSIRRRTSPGRPSSCWATPSARSSAPRDVIPLNEAPDTLDPRTDTGVTTPPHLAREAPAKRKAPAQVGFFFQVFSIPRPRRAGSTNRWQQ